MTVGRLLAGFLVTAGALAAAWAQPFAAEPLPAPPAPALVAAESRSVDVVEERQLDLLAAEDERLRTLVTGLRTGSAPYVRSLGGARTLVLTPRGLDYGLADLVEAGVAEQQPDGAVLIAHHVLVAPGAHLTLALPGQALRLRSDSTGFASLVAWKADLELAGAEGQRLVVTSWDPARGQPDTQVADGRAYVRVVSDAMDVAHVAATRLGFWAGRTGGVAYTGGASGPATGAIVDSTFEHGHYGVFASGTEGLRVVGATFTDSAVDGLALHRHTRDTTVVGSTASGNGRDGFSADRGAEELTLTDATATLNAEYGVHFDGAPLSDGPSAGGTSLRAYGALSVTGGVLRGNGKAGVRVVDADEVTIAGTELADNRDGVVLVDTAAPTTVAGTTITGAHRFGVTATGGTATVADNRVAGADTPIRVRDASVAVTGNSIEAATNHGISVVGAAVATTVVDNDIAGRGPSGLDLHRLSVGVSVEPSGNDLDGWQRDRDNWIYWSSFVPNHPMLLLWLLILGAPLALGLRARRRHRPGAPPYRDDVRRDRPAPRRVHLARPASLEGPAA